MDDKEVGIVDRLLNHDLTGFCFQIFGELDSKSLTNCRLVCQDWKNFIDHHFFELPKGKRYLQREITFNTLSDTFQPRVESTLVLEHEEDEFFLYDVEADKNGICVTADSGHLFSYKFQTLDKQWHVKVGDEPLQICMNDEKVFAVPVYTDGSVYIINRSNGKLFHTFENAHQFPIFGVQTYKHFLATADKRGTIKFHDISNILKPNLIYQETFNTPPRTENGFSHLDSDHNRLVSGSTNGEIILWDFETGKKLKTIDAKQRIQSLKIKWPIVVTCTADCKSFDDDLGNIIYNLKIFIY